MSFDRLRSRVRALYFGHTQQAIRFQGLLLALDLLVIGFFIGSQFIAEQAWFWIADIAIAAFLASDLLARLFAFGTVRRWLKFPTTWIDLVVLATLLLPAVLHNWGFLRILRLWTLVHSERFWNVLARGRYDDTYVEDIAKSASTLVTFVFVSAGATQAFFLSDEQTKLENFAGALQFVVSLLTSTGYGDIFLFGVSGRLWSTALMLIGFTLFLSVAQKVIRPPRKTAVCRGCGLKRHETDARHCRNCGAALPESLRRLPDVAREGAKEGG